MNDNEQLRALMREHGLQDELATTLLAGYSVDEVRDILKVVTGMYSLPANERPPTDAATVDLPMLLGQMDETRAWFAGLSPGKAAKVRRNMDVVCRHLHIPTDSPASFILMGSFRIAAHIPPALLDPQQRAMFEDFHNTD